MEAGNSREVGRRRVKEPGVRDCCGCDDGETSLMKVDVEICDGGSGCSRVLRFMVTPLGDVDSDTWPRHGTGSRVTRGGDEDGDVSTALGGRQC